MKNVCRWMEQGTYTGKILELFNNDELFVLVSVWFFFSNIIDFFFFFKREGKLKILFTLIRVYFS